MRKDTVRPQFTTQYKRTYASLCQSLEIIYHNLALELPKEVAYIDSNLMLSAETKEHMKSLLEALVHLCNTRKDMINM